MSYLKLQTTRCAGAFRLSSRQFQSFHRYLPTFSISQNDFHRRIDVGRESSVELANIRFCLFNFPEKWRARHPGAPSALSAKYYRWNSYTRAGVTKEKNKFDQSEGGGYRFGYSFRKRRRILFLRKPDKGLFTRIFSHTRRLRTSSHASRKRDENITNGLPYHLYINNSASETFSVKCKISKTGLISELQRRIDNNFGEYGLEKLVT